MYHAVIIPSETAVRCSSLSGSRVAAGKEEAGTWSIMRQRPVVWQQTSLVRVRDSSVNCWSTPTRELCLGTSKTRKQVMESPVPECQALRRPGREAGERVQV